MSAGSSFEFVTMSKRTSRPSSVWTEGTRAQYAVSSLSVDALMKPPTPSIAFAISFGEGRRCVPLKKRCSMKCETPASRSSSSREPPPNMRTTLDESRSAIESVTSLAPPGSAWIRCWEAMGAQAYDAAKPPSPPPLVTFCLKLRPAGARPLARVGINQVPSWSAPSAA